MLDNVIKKQLRVLFRNLDAHYTLDVVVTPKHPKRTELLDTLNDFASCSTHITLQSKDGDGLHFSILKDGKDLRIKFRSIPNGHEFSALVFAILNSDDKEQTSPDKHIVERVQQLRGPIHLVTYVSLTCVICSEVVQTLNTIIKFNNQIHHEIVDGGINKMEVIRRKVMSLPSVFADRELFLVGRVNYTTILDKLEAKYGTYKNNCV